MFIFPQSSINEVDRKIVVEKWQFTMTRCWWLSNVAIFSLDERLQSQLVLIQMLLTELTSAPNNESIGIEYCQKISKKSIVETNFNTAYEKYHRYFCQYSIILAATQIPQH